MKFSETSTFEKSATKNLHLFLKVILNENLIYLNLGLKCKERVWSAAVLFKTKKNPPYVCPALLLPP